MEPESSLPYSQAHAIGSTTLCKTQQDTQYTYNVTLRRVGRVISVKYCVCVCVCVCSMPHIINCGLPRSKIFFLHYLTKGTVYKNVTEHEMCFDFLYNFCRRHLSF